MIGTPSTHRRPGELTYVFLVVSAVRETSNELCNNS